MNILTNETEKALIIKLEGKMMLGYEANDFHEAIKSGVEKNKERIVVDLSQVKFISSWGIGILVHGYTTATNADVSFKLASIPNHISEIFKKVKLHSIFSQFNSVEEALKS